MENITPAPLEQNIVNTKLAIKLLINVSTLRCFSVSWILVRKFVLLANNTFYFVLQDIKNFNGSAENLKKLNELGRVKIYTLRELIDRLETYSREQPDDAMHKLSEIVKSEKDQLQR